MTIIFQYLVLKGKYDALISLYFISNLTGNWLFKQSKKCGNSLLAWRKMFNLTLQFIKQSSSEVHYYIGLLLPETSHGTTLNSSENWLNHQSDHPSKEIPETRSFLKALVRLTKRKIPSPPLLA